MRVGFGASGTSWAGSTGSPGSGPRKADGDAAPPTGSLYCPLAHPSLSFQATWWTCPPGEPTAMTKSRTAHCALKMRSLPRDPGALCRLGGSQRGGGRPGQTCHRGCCSKLVIPTLHAQEGHLGSLRMVCTGPRKRRIPVYRGTEILLQRKPREARGMLLCNVTRIPTRHTSQAASRTWHPRRCCTLSGAPTTCCVAS